MKTAGAFAGAVLGLGIAYGAAKAGEFVLDSIADSENETSIFDECLKSAPEGKRIEITSDSLGNPVCSYR